MLIDTIERTIEEYRSELAYIRGTERLTFGDIGDRADAIAAGLAHNDIGVGDAVGLQLEASVDYPAACLGIWRAGGIVVPLDVALTDSEIRYFTDLAQVRVILAAGPKSGSSSAAPRVDISRLVNDQRAGGIGTRSRAEDSLVLFTSGTTGPPKGIIHTHESLDAMMERHISSSGLTCDDVLLATSIFNTTFGLCSYILEPLTSGARVVIVHPFHPRDALEAAQREGVTRIQTVPAVLKLITAVEPTPSLPTLRTVRLGAATLDEASRSEFEARFGIQPIQGYGMSEVGRVAATNNGPRRPSDGIVGRPEVDVRLFADGAEPVPEGECGEIGVRSNSMCRPFYLMGDGSRESFPMRDGYYLTGDIGRFTEHGYLAIAGRRKSFILTPGIKVDPREVEDVLMEHPRVVEAAVLPQPGRAGYEIVKAVVVTSKPVTSAEILSFCSERLTAGKCPQIVEFVDRLPRNSLGKVEIGKLQAGNCHTVEVAAETDRVPQ